MYNNLSPSYGEINSILLNVEPIFLIGENDHFSIPPSFLIVKLKQLQYNKIAIISSEKLLLHTLLDLQPV